MGVFFSEREIRHIEAEIEKRAIRGASERGVNGVVRNEREKRSKKKKCARVSFLFKKRRASRAKKCRCHRRTKRPAASPLCSLLITRRPAGRRAVAMGDIVQLPQRAAEALLEERRRAVNHRRQSMLWRRATPLRLFRPLLSCPPTTSPTSTAPTKTASASTPSAGSPRCFSARRCRSCWRRTRG